MSTLCLPETRVAMSSPHQLDWRGAALQAAVAPHCPGLLVQVLEKVDSTSTHLLELCRTRPTPLRTPLLLVAEQQTGGRGRQGRTWHSARGASLTFSLAWPLQAADLSGLSLAVGVALAEALDTGTSAGTGAGTGPAYRIGLKWPNDLWLLDAAAGAARPGPAWGRKLGGILIETLSRGPQCVAIIGIGLNVLPLAVPDAGSGVACLQEIDADVNAPQTLHRVALPLLQALHAFEAGGFAGFEARYRRRDVLQGHEVQAGALAGKALGVASNGALRLRCVDGERKIVAGEVSVRLRVQALAAAPQDAC